MSTCRGEAVWLKSENFRKRLVNHKRELGGLPGKKGCFALS